nr:DUF4377 domain-containing protein [Parabacteroides goldsteinii]
MNKILFLVFVFTLSLTGCSKDDITTEQLTIASETRIGMAEGPRNCYLVKNENNKNWEFMYNSINGFEYEAGYEYVIEVKIENIKNPPADASSVKYSLIKIISKTKKNSEGLPEQKPWDSMSDSM